MGNHSVPGALILAAVLLFCLPVLPSVAASEPSPAYKASVIDIEIQVLNKDIEWLNAKIERFKHAGRFVPEAFHRSMALKKKRLRGLVYLKERYEQMISSTPKPDPGQVKKPKPLKQKPQDSASSPSLSPEQKPPASFMSKEQLVKKIKEAGLTDWVDLVAEKDLLKIENSLPILFASGSAVIAKEYQPFFKSLATLVKDFDVRIHVDGYADKDPIRTKKYPSNFELGAARAANVVHELVNHGIRRDVFRIGSTGDHRFVSGQRPDLKSLDRFVTITILFRS